MKESNFPHEAIAVIDAVLQYGRKKGHLDCNWQKISPSEHIDHATRHLKDLLYEVETGEDHLAHALCRLAMAVTVREQEEVR